LFEHDGGGADQVAFGDVRAPAGAGDADAAGDRDRVEGDARQLGVEEVDDGGADAGCVDRDLGVAGERLVL
jgi:hypothetical protein